MSLLCLLGLHKPSPPSLNRTEQGTYTALCEDCGVPIDRKESRRWKPTEPLT